MSNPSKPRAEAADRGARRVNGQIAKTASRETVRVRPPEPTDFAAISELLEQLGYPSTEEQVAARLSAMGASPDHHVLVAELRISPQERFLAGLVALEIGHFFHKDEPHAHLTAVVSDRRFRHRGIARALLEEAQAIARRAGCDLVHVRSNHQRDDAHAFYRALGFEETHLTFDKKL
jgi:ribosomal protein S18 acetylase RimI-like enzyme